MSSASASSRLRSFPRAAALSRFAPMANSYIPNLTPAIGRTSTQSSRRLKRLSNRSRDSFPASVRRSALDTQRWTSSFLSAICNQCQSASDQSAIRRVKGAWWPSRSSKPLSILHMQDRGRFDSYPLRQFIFDFRFLIFDWPQMLADRIKRQTSNIKHRERR